MQKANLAKAFVVLSLVLPIIIIIVSSSFAQEVYTAQDANRIAENIAKQKQQDRQKTLQLTDQLYQSGKRYYKQGEYDKAIDAFKSVLELDPTNLNAAKFIQESEVKLEQLKKKQAQQQKAAQLEEQAKIMKQQQTAQQKIETPFSPAQKSQDVKKILLKEAKESLRNKDFETAVRDYEALLAMEPKNKEFQDALLKAKTEQIKVSIKQQAKLVGYDQQVQQTKKSLQEDTMMLEVESAYIPKEKAKPAVIEIEEILSPEEKAAEEAKRKLREKLSGNMVPALDIRDADIRDFIRQLITMTGVNIILDEKALMKVSEGKPLKITFNTVSELNILDLLDIALKATDLTYKIEPNYIWISDRETLEKEKLITKTYRLKYGVRKIRKVQLKEFEPKTYKSE